MGFFVCKFGPLSGYCWPQQYPGKENTRNQARSHYPTLHCVKAHVAKMRNKKYDQKMNSSLRQASWTRKLDNTNMQVKKMFDSNHYAHPNVLIRRLEWAASIFREGRAPCIGRANQC